jgi:hypothetical protein
VEIRVEDPLSGLAHRKRPGGSHHPALLKGLSKKFVIVRVISEKAGSPRAATVRQSCAWAVENFTCLAIPG